VAFRQVGRQVPFLSLSCRCRRNSPHAVPVYPVEHVQVLFAHVPWPPQTVDLEQSIGERMQTPFVI
jgi:hypothetical protein